MQQRNSGAAPAKESKVSFGVKLLWRLFWIGLLGAVSIFVLAAAGAFGKMPTAQELENPEANLASEIYSADGLLMGKYYSENRSEVKFGEISPNVIHALIATEDERFEEHSGIDAKAVGRAIYSLGRDGGASTVTQQLAKMILVRKPGNIFSTIIQKIKEWIVAVKLERNFTKNEILTLYLNRAPWGNIYGIRNASRTYFQKEPIDLKVEEAAVLIGMLKGTGYDPVRFPAKALGRRNTVIDQMVVAKQKFLSPAEAATLKAKPIITNFKKIDENIGIAPHFRRALIDLLKPWVEKSRNPKTGEPYDLYRDGLKIYTTIDSRMQKYAEEATDQHMPQLQSKLNSYLSYIKKVRKKDLFANHPNSIENGIKYSERWKNMTEEGFNEEQIRKSFNVPVRMKVFSWKGEKHEKDTTMTPIDSIKYQKTLMQTSFAAMDPRSGEVKAWVGSIDYKWFKYDHVTAARQVGSTFKPFVYTLAVTDAGYTPETYIPGGALTLGGKTISGGGGTMAYCLSRSLNAAAWRLISVVGVKRTIEFAQQCGITAKLPPYYSIALGTAEIPMLQMLQGYTMFPNKGYNTKPVFVTRIEDKNGNLIHEFPVAQSNQVIGEADAYTMVKIMEGVIKSGTAKRINSYNIPVAKAGKTGTTNGNTDGWFIGYTPELVAGSWVGCDDPFIPVYQNNVGGAEMSAPRWGIFMSKVYADKKLGYAKKDFDEPVTMQNDPIMADSYLEQIYNQGQGEDLYQDMGNGDVGDFMDVSGADKFEDQNLPANTEPLDGADTAGSKPSPAQAPPAPGNNEKSATPKVTDKNLPPADKKKATTNQPPKTEKPKVENDF